MNDSHSTGGMIGAHLAKLRARNPISAEEEQVIRASVREIIKVPAQGTAAPAMTPLDVSMILISGIAARQKDLRDGKRQITELQVPGDYTDLHSFTLKYLDHDVVAMTDCTFAVVPHTRLREMTERHPRLTRIYWFATNLDAAIHREWELSLGRRSATASMAHLFCELYVRLGIVGLAQDGRFDLPLTQTQLGECLGITPVHANRTLQDLRRADLLDFASGMVRILDLDGLKRTGDFNPAYLYLEPQDR